MRFPVNFVLYLGSAGLLGLAGYLFYHATSKLGAPPAQSFYERGSSQAAELIKRGKGAGASSATWSYMNQEWWAKFKDANFTGKLPPPPPDATADLKKPEAPAVVQTPLENIIELITLVCDGHSGGTAGSTQIVVRYKPEAQVEPPPEELRRRELLRNGGAGTPSGPSDVALPPPQGGRDGGNRRGGRQGPATPMPSSTQSTNEWIQTVKPGEALWGQYGNIKLARVSGDCDFAVFTRELPAAAGAGDGQEAPKPVEEKLYKLGVGISNAVMEAIRMLGGHPATQVASQPATAAASSGVSWIDTDETIRKDNVFHIGRNDAAKFQDSEDLLAGVGLDDYVSRYGGSTRGVRIVNVDSQLASKYGVAAGEVIVAINDVPVRTRSEAINTGKKQYNLGTRTFVIKFLNTAGQFVERTYQAPDKKN